MRSGNKSAACSRIHSRRITLLLRHWIIGCLTMRIAGPRACRAGIRQPRAGARRGNRGRAEDQTAAVAMGRAGPGDRARRCPGPAAVSTGPLRPGHSLAREVPAERHGAGPPRRRTARAVAASSGTSFAASIPRRAGNNGPTSGCFPTPWANRPWTRPCKPPKLPARRPSSAWPGCSWPNAASTKRATARQASQSPVRPSGKVALAPTTDGLARSKGGLTLL